MRVCTLLLITAVFGSGCGTFSSISKALGTDTPSDIEMVVVEPGGKGLFVIRPDVNIKDCMVEVETKGGLSKTDCTNQFVVGCDATVDEDTPFCWLVTEVGPVRDTAYPKKRRTP